MITRQRGMMALMLLPLLLVAAIATMLVTRQDDNTPTLDPTVGHAIDWLRTQQLPGGGFAGFSGEADLGMSADVALAFAAAGIDPSEVSADGGTTLGDYLALSAPAATSDAGLAAKLALAMLAAGEDPRDAAGADLIDTLHAALDDASNWYGISFYGHALAVLALDSAGEEVPSPAIEALLTAQTPEGSWGFAGSPDAGTGDSNTTAVVIQALAAVERGDDAIASGLDYLRSLQDEEGAIAYDASAAPDLVGDANSTALAMQAFIAAGEDPSSLPNGDLAEALGTFQNESGAFQYQPAFPDDSLLATAQAIPALIGVTLPYDALSVTAPMFATGIMTSSQAW